MAGFNYQQANQNVQNLSNLREAIAKQQTTDYGAGALNLLAQVIAARGQNKNRDRAQQAQQGFTQGVMQDITPQPAQPIQNQATAQIEGGDAITSNPADMTRAAQPGMSLAQSMIGRGNEFGMPEQTNAGFQALLAQQSATQAADLKASQDRGLKDPFKDTMSLRKEGTSTAKDFLAMQKAHNRLQSVVNYDEKTVGDFMKRAGANAVARGDAPGAFADMSVFKGNIEAVGDLALIFNFMKMVDPGSVVRESEFATAENAAGVPERVSNLYNKMLAGERLTPEQRQAFIFQSEQMYGAAKESAMDVLKPIVEQAKQNNIPLNQLGLGWVDEESPASSAPEMDALTQEALAAGITQEEIDEARGL